MCNLIQFNLSYFDPSKWVAYFEHAHEYIFKRRLKSVQGTVSLWFFTSELSLQMAI